MIRFAAMLAALPHDETALDRYLAGASEADRAAAKALLSGQRPPRLAGLAALLAWSAEIAEVPDWLVQASLAASGDRAETAALVLPPPNGAPPSLAEVVDRLSRATRVTAHGTMVSLWSRLPAPANHVVNRLASGTFRTTRPAAPATTVPTGHGGSVSAVMVLAQASRAEITLALWQAGAPVPVARLPLTLPETPELMTWIRANVAQRFGPVQQVPPVQVFRLGFQGLKPNARRKSGYDLQGAMIEAWLPGTDPASADPLSRLDAFFSMQKAL